MSSAGIELPTRPWRNVRRGDGSFSARGETSGRPTRFAALLLAAWTVYALLRAALWWGVDPRYSPFVQPRAFVHGLARGWVWAAMSAGIVLLCRAFPWSWRRAPLLAALHACAALVCSLVESLAFRGCWKLLAPHAVLRPFAIRWLLDLPANLFLYLVVASLAIAWQQRAVLDRGRRRALQLRACSAEARLHALTAQLQPHFLGNALNAVAELVHQDVERARRTLGQLRALLLGPLAAPAADRVSLADELALLEAYLDIQRTRFGARLALAARAEPAALPCLVPRFLLQPLVENAVQHGSPRHVEVAAERAGDRLVLRVRDDGAGLRATAREGVGLRNSRLRVEALGGALRLGGAPGGGTEVALELPATVTAAPAPAPTPAPAAPPSPRVRAVAVVPAVIAGWAALGLVLCGVRVLFNPYVPTAVTFGEELPGSMIFVALFAIVTAGLVVAVRAWPRRLALQALLVAAAALLLPLLRRLAFDVAAPEGLDEMTALNLQADLSICIAAVAAAHAMVWLDRARERDLEAARLEAELAEAALQAQRARIDPAALAGALEAIDQTAGSDVERADELTVELARSLRGMAAA